MYTAPAGTLTVAGEPQPVRGNTCPLAFCEPQLPGLPLAGGRGGSGLVLELGPGRRGSVPLGLCAGGCRGAGTG